MGTARTRANYKYSKKAYDRIAVMVKKGRKSEIRAVADKAGQSLNAYIIQAIEQRMEREK